MVEAGKTPLLTMRVGQQYYAVSVAYVVEVAAMVALDRVPDAPPEMLGIANRHGAALPVIDLRLVFDQPQTPINSATLFAVVTYDNHMFGLVADEVLQVQHFELPDQRVTVSGRYIQHILGQATQLIHLIDLSALLAAFIPDDLSGDRGNSTTT